MKKYVLFFMFLVFLSSSQVFSQGSPASGGSSGETAIIFHPLGFLQMGPIVELQHSFDGYFAASLYWRYRALGLIDQLITTDNFLNDMTWDSMAFGTGLTFYPQGMKTHSLYYGFLIEYYFGGTFDDSDPVLAWNGFHHGIGLVARGGYHLFFDRVSFLHLGVIAGVGYTFERYWEYTDYAAYTAVYGAAEPQRTYLDPQVTFIGMLEISFGFLF